MNKAIMLSLFSTPCAGMLSTAGMHVDLWDKRDTPAFENTRETDNGFLFILFV